MVYLLPGTHELSISFRRDASKGLTTASLRADAGKTYMLSATQVDQTHAKYAIKAMPEGFVLTYRDITPGFFAKYETQNSHVDPADVR